MASFDACAERILTRTATVAVIGQGYVGLTVATAGMRVQAIDVIAERLEVLVAGRNLVPGVPDDPFVPAYATESLLLDARNAIGPRGCAMVTTL